MNFNVIAQQAAPNGAASSGTMLIPMVVIFGVMFFFMWHSQKKEQKRRQALIDGIKIGDKVLTIGGIFGEVVTVKDNSFIIKIAENTKVEISKNAVSTVPAAETTPAAKGETPSK